MTKSILHIFLIVVLLCQSCARDKDMGDYTIDSDWDLIESEDSNSDSWNRSKTILDTIKKKDSFERNKKIELISNILNSNYNNESWNSSIIFSDIDVLDKNTKVVKASRIKEQDSIPSITSPVNLEKQSATLKLTEEGYDSLQLNSTPSVDTLNKTSAIGAIKENEGPALVGVIGNKVRQPLASALNNTYNDTIEKRNPNYSQAEQKITRILDNGSTNNVIEAVDKTEKNTNFGPVKNKIYFENTNSQRKMAGQERQTLKKNVNGSKLGDIDIRILHKVPTYTTNSKHTLLVEIINKGKEIKGASLSLGMPEGWDLISTSNVGALGKNQRKKILLSIYLPSNASVGIQNIRAYLLDMNNQPIVSKDLEIDVAANYDIDVFNVSAPQNVRAGETIEAIYGLKNMGNIAQKIILTSNNEILGERNFILEPNTLVMVHLNQKTDEDIYSFRNQSTSLEVFGIVSGLRKKAYKSVEVFPVKIKKEEIYFKYPVRASLYYNSFTNQQYHFSTLSFEVAGNGFLDLKKDHYLDFIVRGPKQSDLRQFGNNDQYSLKYQFKDKTTIFLGDHSYFINRLGINGKFGMGFKVDQKVNDWTLSAFYTKPRLYDYDAGAYYGVKSIYRANPFLKLGLSLTRSKRMVTTANQKFLTLGEETGEIMTLDLDYSKENTRIVAEASASSTKEHIDFAQYVNLRKTLGKFLYSGSITLSGENYFGTINNSLQFTNALNYRVSGWTFGLGQSLSRVNQRLNPLYFGAEPYYENYFATLAYRLDNHNTFRFRFDKRVREDQLEPKNYHYKENGFNYSYNYRNDVLTANFNGRLGKTKNLLSNDTDYRNTYSHNVNVSYGVDRKFRLRGGLFHNYTNRYGNSGNNLNYVRYNLGFNYKFGKNFLFNANFNSGFSPEDSYLKRDYISLNLMANFPKNHQFEIRANYFEYPGVIGNREIFAYGKYTYSFGVPLKKIKEQGGVMGYVIANDTNINTGGIKIIAAGKTVMTDKTGRFEIQNLPLGRNYILVEQSTLDQGVITSSKIPYEVIIEENKNIELNIVLVKSAMIKGSIQVVKTKGATMAQELESFIKLENQDFTYYSESKKNGSFEFHQIVPGTYDITLMRLKKNDNLFYEERTSQVTLTEGEVLDETIFLKLKARKIKFKNKNFKVGNYEEY